VLGFSNQRPDPSYFSILSADMIDGGMPELGTAEGGARVDEIVGDAQVLFADNVRLPANAFLQGRETEEVGAGKRQTRRLKSTTLFARGLGVPTPYTRDSETLGVLAETGVETVDLKAFA
jgi:hypothetical protein